MKTKNLLAAFGFCLSASTLAYAAMPGMEQNGMLVDSKGMALYTYAKDSDGMSACNGKCAENWPPLMAESGAEAMGEWTVIKREDGSMQWAYDGHPLYTYAKDTAAGQATGDGKGGTWSIAKP